MIKRLMLILAVFVFALACMKKEESIKQLDFVDLYKGVYGHNEPGTKVIKDNNTWIEFKKQFVQDVTFYEKEVDFEKYMIIGIFLGKKDTNSYSIEIKKIVLKGSKIYVYYIIGKPVEDNIEFLIETYPIHVVKVQKMPQNVVFSNEETID